MALLKIAFSGLGVIGSYYGSMLAAANHLHPDLYDLYFIIGEGELAAIRSHGIYCRRVYDTDVHGIPTLATDNPLEIGAPVDYLFCCTSSYTLKENIRKLAPIIGRNTVIIPLLDGIDASLRIQRVYPHQTVWEGCVYLGAHLTAPGQVHKFSPRDMLFFGNGRGVDYPRQKELLRILQAARINVCNPDDIISRVWQKFFVTSPTATLTTFLNIDRKKLITNKRYTPLYLTLCSELRSLAALMGVKLPPNIIEKTFEIHRFMPFAASTLMHADSLADKSMEEMDLDSFTGVVLKFAKLVGMEVPAYRFLYEGLLHAVVK